jgi:uncharacterized phage protein (TIGR02218 family)
MTAFEEYLAGDVTTLCHCWRVTLADASVMGFTDHDGPLSTDGTAFAPDSGMAASEARRAEGMGVASMDVAGALSADAITEADILAGRYDGAVVETLLVNWADPAQFQRIGRASIAKVTRRDGQFVAELESLGRGLDVVHGRHLARHCDAALGDARCGVDLDQSAYKGEGTVVALDGADGVVVSGLSGFADGWFSGGRLTWTSGARAGLSDRVTASRAAAGATAIAYWPDTAEPPAPGDTFDIFAGCDKAFATCKAKFANALNFRGFPHLPGNDSAYSYVNQEGEFDGAPLVP